MKTVRLLTAAAFVLASGAVMAGEGPLGPYGGYGPYGYGDGYGDPYGLTALDTLDPADAVEPAADEEGYGPGNPSGACNGRGYNRP